MAKPRRGPTPTEAVSWPVPPWLQDSFDQLLSDADHLHHALLITGTPGIGKSTFARHLAAALLCESTAAASAAACGVCQSCRWLQARSHPDFRALIPERDDPDFVASGSKKPSAEIRIDQVRGLRDFLGVSAHRSGRRVILIDPANAMNVVTANSILKTLEEPSANTTLLLVTSHPDRLLQTVRSRCRVLPLRGPKQPQAIDWLLENGASDRATADRALTASGSVLHALHDIEPDVAAAHQAILETLASLPETLEQRAVDALVKHDAHRWAKLFERWISDLSRVKVNAQPHYFPAMSERFKALGKNTDLAKITSFQSELLSLVARIEHPVNPRLLCESTVLAYCQMFDAGRRTR